jgi:hypothetical protein
MPRDRKSAKEDLVFSLLHEPLHRTLKVLFARLGVQHFKQAVQRNQRKERATEPNHLQGLVASSPSSSVLSSIYSPHVPMSP